MKIKIQITVESDEGQPEVVRKWRIWIGAPYDRRRSG